MSLYLAHHGILGMRWGVRRYQNKDGSYTPEGRARYLKDTADMYSHENAVGDHTELRNAIKKSTSYEKYEKFESAYYEYSFAMKEIDDIANNAFSDTYYRSEQYKSNCCIAAMASLANDARSGAKYVDKMPPHQTLAESLYEVTLGDGNQSSYNEDAVQLIRKGVYDSAKRASAKYAEAEKKLRENVKDILDGYGDVRVDKEWTTYSYQIMEQFSGSFYSDYTKKRALLNGTDIHPNGVTTTTFKNDISKAETSFNALFGSNTKVLNNWNATYKGIMNIYNLPTESLGDLATKPLDRWTPSDYTKLGKLAGVYAGKD